MLPYLSVTSLPALLVIAASMLYPLHFVEELQVGAQEYGALASVYGCGAMLSVLVVRVKRAGIKRSVLVRTAFGGFALCVMVTAVMNTLWACYAAAAVLAMCHATVRIERNAFILEVIQREWLARVTSFFEVASTVCLLIMLGSIGPVADRIGVQATWAILCCIVAVATLVLLRVEPPDGQSMDTIYEVPR